MNSPRRFFRPGGFVVARVHRPVFAVADGVHTARVDAQADEFLAHGQRAALAQGAVVFLGAALVAVAFDADGRRRVGLSDSRPRRATLARSPALTTELSKSKKTVSALKDFGIIGSSRHGRDQ